MADINANSSLLGGVLTDLLMKDDLAPGDQASYELAKAIYLYHPLGAKLAEAPIAAAQSQARLINVPGAPEDMIMRAFYDEWARLECDKHIFSAAVTARIYGVSAIIVGASNGTDSNSPLQPDKIADTDIFFNVMDPLNASGSFAGITNPNSPDFQRFDAVSNQGKQYHPSRTCVMLNEQPVYLAYEASAYGYAGRSVYQRALYPLKSFVQTMITDDLVTRKAGLLVAKLKAPGSIINNAMQAVMGVKRALLKAARTNDVLSIGIDEEIHAVDLTNVAGASETARNNILLNAAMAADMPAKWLNNETFAEGFGEGTEDAKAVARYVDRYRIKLGAAYRFLDNLVMRKAWTPAFYQVVKTKFPDAYGSMDYTTALYSWINAFAYSWPSLLVEPESEKSKLEKVKFDAIVQLMSALDGKIDPANQAKLYEWAVDNINENKLLFPNPLMLDIDALQDHLEQAADKAQEQADALAASGGIAGGGDQGEGKPKPKPSQLKAA